MSIKVDILKRSDTFVTTSTNKNFVGFNIETLCYFEGLKFVRDFLQTDTMKSLGAYLLDERYSTRDRVAPEHEPATTEYDDEYIKHLSGVFFHPAGSCKMGALDDSTAVVDPQLR